MFKKLFKPDFSNEENVYSYATSYITNLKSLLDKWIEENKYRRIPELQSLLDLLLEIEMEINYLVSKKDAKLVKQIASEHEKLDIVLIKLKNAILSICEHSREDETIILISVELIKLRNLLSRNISIPALKSTSDKLGTYNYLKEGEKDIYTNIILLEHEIYIRKQSIATTSLKYR